LGFSTANDLSIKTVFPAILIYPEPFSIKAASSGVAFILTGNFRPFLPNLLPLRHKSPYGYKE
jgi:hypothetical protein